MPVQIIYGDGTNQVAVGATAVVFSDGKGQVLTLSRAAFREVVLSWERLQDIEAASERGDA